MKLNIQLFGGRGASSSSDTEPKKATFISATRNMDEGGRREDIKVNGVSFKYKSINVGVFNATQEEYQKNNPMMLGRGADKYIAVIITDNETNGASITSGKTRKEAIQKSKDLIDKRRKDILKAIGTGKKISR